MRFLSNSGGERATSRYRLVHSLAEASEFTSLTVHVPRPLPAGIPHIMIRSAPECLVVSWRVTPHDDLFLYQGAEMDWPVPVERYQPLQVEGQKLFVLTPGRAGPGAEVARWVDGVATRLSGPLMVDSLVSMALSLRPYQPGRPAQRRAAS